VFDAYATFQAKSVASAASGRSVDQGVLEMGRALSKFNNAHWRGTFKRLLAKASGKSRDLLDLNQVRQNKTVEAMHETPCMTIEIAKIKGSECRVCDFDIEFLPLSQANRQRWAGVYAARLAGISLPAISVVQVGDVYYVRDGHHRISVARLLGEQYIDATAQVWEVAGEAAAAPAMSMQLVTAM
jgi:hypothetical protein